MDLYHSKSVNQMSKKNLAKRNIISGLDVSMTDVENFERNTSNL